MATAHLPPSAKVGLRDAPSRRAGGPSFVRPKQWTGAWIESNANAELRLQVDVDDEGSMVRERRRRLCALAVPDESVLSCRGDVLRRAHSPAEPRAEEGVVDAKGAPGVVPPAASSYLRMNGSECAPPASLLQTNQVVGAG